jgi:multidrug efflux pump subunit AcrB
MDADVLIALKREHHPTAGYMKKLRKRIAEEFPGSGFYFQSADVVSQVLNFGVSAPIDVQVEYPNLTTSAPLARRLRDAIREVPGTTDVHITQVLDYPSFKLDVDRERAAQLGLSQRDIANSMLVSLSSSSLVAPSYFLNPANNVNYTVVVKSPLRRIDSVDKLLATPITPPSASNLLQPVSAAVPTSLPEAATAPLSNLAAISPQSAYSQISHYTVQRVLDVCANVEGRDLASVVRDLRKKIDAFGQLPAGMKITVRGQNEVMERSFKTLGLGLILAGLLVYCLMVVLYQSWLDPLIIMVAVPGALVGILWMLAITHTTLNVESLMGSIMAIGIAVSNSILLVNFANDVRVEEGLDAKTAALQAGKIRLRPVLMTALAMIIGMIPMALGTGEGGEQNAPLGRAVIGGLVVATGVTLLTVPLVYSWLRTKLPTKHTLEERFLAEERGEAPVPAGGH